MSIASLFDPGILRSALLPSFQQHLLLAIPAYALGRALNRVESKDVLWSLAPASIAWYTVLTQTSSPFKLSYNLSGLDTAFRSLSRRDQLLLTGISLWSIRLFYRIISRAYRRGADDPRYSGEEYHSSAFWNWAPLTTFLPEIIVQSLLTLPFTLTHNVPHASVLVVKSNEWKETFGVAAVGLWSAAFAMEVLADWQLARHQKKGERGLCRTGVWSIVRHPNYLADFLTYLSYPLLHLSYSSFSPWHLLSPLSSYLFLRVLGGDAQTESYQEQRYMESDPNKMLDLIEMREAENSFWPDWKSLGNVWTWTVIGLGAVGVWGERVLRSGRVF